MKARFGHTARTLSTLCIGAFMLSCARSGDNEGTVATGTIEVNEADIAPTVGGRVLRVWVDDGDAIDVGDTLATLMQATLPAELVQRRARASAAQSQLRDLEAGPRADELRRQEAELRSAEAEADRATKDAERYAALLEGGGISEQQYQQARAAAATAVARRDAASGTLRLLRQGTRPNQVAAARGELESARASVAAAEATEGDLVLVSPMRGRVMARHVEPGEVLAPGETAVTVGEIGRPWARVFVGQHAVPTMELGQAVTARLDGSEREFAGRITSIDDHAQFTPRVALTEEERADLMFGVKVTFEDTTGLLRPGLPVTVRIPPARRAAATGPRP